MSAQEREQELADTFVRLADTLVSDYDVVDMLHMLVERCCHLLDATDVGILLPDSTGMLSVIASTSERGHLIGLLQLSAEQGPGVDAFESGMLVTADSIADTRQRWPRFAAEAAGLGFESTHAIPLRLRDQTIGSLDLYRDAPGALNQEDATIAQALGDVATIGILQDRSLRESTRAREQLQSALDSRVVIEQAKGAMAYASNITTDEAFSRLRASARDSRRRLTDVAREVVARASDPGSTR